jgi:predicted RNase H-like HicB family nuclease
MSDVIVQIAHRDDGKYIAASTSASPYFCFEGATEAEVKQTVDTALAFYLEAKKVVQQKKAAKQTNITVTRIRSTSRVRRPLLDVA